MILCRLLSLGIRCAVVSFSVSYVRRILANKKRPAAILNPSISENSRIVIVTTAAIPWRTGEQLMCTRQRLFLPEVILSFTTGIASHYQEPLSLYQLIQHSSLADVFAGTAVNPALRAAELAAGSEYEVCHVVEVVLLFVA